MKGRIFLMIGIFILCFAMYIGSSVEGGRDVNLETELCSSYKHGV